ncbi:peptidylprolyl isomerase [Allopusillimonas soli]|uniref:Periplasmic chaperone PpiD n=2 Tax=Allopusillimonas soli TaxID=659016 RepID=A0A853FCN2_9BURK|nr:SurA N-terminal domain-containing protein [Allopusillimonas soli]TEA75612.1 peptidylprolyl isomerase [Allopusillimonas soli]
MFDFIRTHQRLMQFLLLILILPSFALIGISGYTNYVSGDHDLVKVGSGAVTQQMFDQARSNQLRQLQSSSQGGFDPAVLDNPQARAELLDSLINRQALIDTARAEHFSVSDTALRQSIAALPQLQENGRFSPELYNRTLAAMGLDTHDFEESQRAELALGRVLGPVARSAAVPATVVQRLETILTEQRTVRLKAFPATDYEKDISVSDDDIKAWYDQNKQSLELPQQAIVQYLLLNEAAAMKDLPEVSEDELRKYYDQNKSRYVRPPRVNVSHIQIDVPAGATGEQRKTAHDEAVKIASQLKANPDTFAEVAREKSQDAGTAKDGGKLGWITQGTWPAALEDAVFSLKKGAISGVIDGPGGFHIFRVNDTQPEHGETFEEARAKVETEVRRQLGSDRFAEMASKLTDLVYENPDSLEPASQALGLPIKTAAGIARDRLLASDEVKADAASSSADASLLGDVRVRRAVFANEALVEKQNTGVIELSPDTMIVLHVKEAVPAHIPELAQVSDHIRGVLEGQRARDAAAEAGKKLLAELSKSPSVTAPEGFGDAQSISRIDPRGLPKQLTDAAFAAPTDHLPQYVGVEGPQGYVLVRVEDAKAGTTDSPALATLPQQLAAAWGKAEEDAVLKALRTQLGVKMLPEAQEVIQGEKKS